MSHHIAFVRYWRKGSDKITFVNDALEDLKGFNDKTFDMVIYFDAPVSYTYPIRKR